MSWWYAAAAAISALGKRAADRQARIDSGNMYGKSKHPIQRAVADARAAGLHPLAALGMSPGSSGIVGSGNIYGSEWDDVGKAVAQAGASRSEEEDRSLSAREVEARIRVLDSEAVLNAARASAEARRAQGGNSSQDFDMVPTVIPPVKGQPSNGRMPMEIERKPITVVPVAPGTKLRSATGLELELDPDLSYDHAQQAQNIGGEPAEWFEGGLQYLKMLVKALGKTYVTPEYLRKRREASQRRR